MLLLFINANIITNGSRLQFRSRTDGQIGWYDGDSIRRFGLLRRSMIGGA